MEIWQQEHETYIISIRNRMTLFFSFLILSIGVLILILSDELYATYTSIFSIILGSTSLVFIYFKKYTFVESLTIYGTAAIMVYGTYNLQASSLFMIIGLLIIVSSFYGDDYGAIILFIFSVLFLIYLLIMKKFTLKVIVIEPYGVELANNAQVLLAFIPACFAVAFLIRRMLLRTIEVQQRQYILLKESQQFMLSQAQLESIRIISGGVAHDFNNILTAILGNISLYKDDERLPEDMLESLKDMESASLKATNLSNQMLNLVKDKTSIFGEINNVNELVQNTCNFSIKGRRSVILYNLDDDLWGVVADVSQISQVIQNLVINADFAMPSGGNIWISTSNVTLERVNKYNLSKDTYIKISVKDNGTGIPVKEQENIFKLFYTTREKGSGIGLAISKSIIKNHHGYINFKSEVDSGTEFFFLIPADPNIKKIEKKYEKAETLLLSGNVVIYEDNRDVIHILSKMLERIGLDTFAATESQSLYPILNNLALRMKVPDIFILDLTVPGDKSGADIIEELKENYPGSYFILSSGFSDNFIFAEFDKYKFDDLIRKPYTFDELKEVLVTYAKKEN